MIQKASAVGTHSLLRLFTERLSRVSDTLLFDDRRRRVVFAAFTVPDDERDDVTRRGAKVVLELLLNQDGEDDIFVKLMTWGAVVLILMIWCIKRFDVTGIADAV